MERKKREGIAIKINKEVETAKITLFLVKKGFGSTEDIDITEGSGGGGCLALGKRLPEPFTCTGGELMGEGFSTKEINLSPAQK